MRRIALAGLLLGVLAGVAGANGRPAGTSTIHFRQGHEQDVAAGLTFGLVLSHDGGATWHWMCEKAIGYGGMYDPDYAYTESGAIFATTFDGLKVNRDGCTFAATPPGMTFISTDELGPDHALYYAAADPADSNIYKSTDDGTTFPTSTMPGILNDWWDSLIVAPSDATKVYLSGYRLQGTNPKVFLLFKSVNGGTSYTALPTTGITASDNSVIDFVGVDPTNADLAYVKVTVENGNVGDGIYRMNTASGTSWTKILDKIDPYGLAFLVRSDGTCVAGTKTLGAWSSTNCSTSTTPTWTALTNPPHISCLVENAAHEVWACTQNYGAPPDVQTDGYGIMKSSDLATWTGVLKYQEIAGPVDCPTGTVQRDMCQGVGASGTWCMLETQLGITSTVVDCSAVPDGATDAGSGSGTTPPKGCCDTGSGGTPTALLAGLVVAGLLLRTRRSKDR